MDQLNERIETVLLKRHVTEAAWLVFKERSFSRLRIILLIIVSLGGIVFWGFSHWNFTDWILGLLLLVLMWGAPVFGYLVLRARTLSQHRSILNHLISYDLNHGGISIRHGDQKREYMWSNFTKHMKSPQVTVLYSTGRKAFIIFPNPVLSEKTETYVLETIRNNQNVPPAIAPPVITRNVPIGELLKKYLIVIVIFVILAIDFILHLHWHDTFPPPDLGK